MKKFKFVKPKFLLGIAIALISLELYLGVLFGYFLGKFLSAKKTGQENKWGIKSIVLHIGRWKLHLHHWFYGLGILTSLFFLNLSLPQFSYGFLGGLIFQGIISYPDWYKVLVKIRKP